MVIPGPVNPVQPSAQPLGGDAQLGVQQHESAGRAQETPVEHSLWDMLTEDERRFFSQQAELGPLTYGRKRAIAQRVDAPLGQRLDVRA
jgi:hypothetical protein